MANFCPPAVSSLSARSTMELVLPKGCCVPINWPFEETNPDIADVLRRDSEVLARIQDGFHTVVKARSVVEPPPLRPLASTRAACAGNRFVRSGKSECWHLGNRLCHKIRLSCRATCSPDSDLTWPACQVHLNYVLPKTRQERLAGAK